jgi:hypothetical protein
MQLAQLDFNNLERILLPRLYVNRPAGASGSLKPGEIITRFLPYIFVVAGLILLLYLVFGGLSLLTSGGDPKAVQVAKGRITTALIGFIIVFVAYWIVQALGIILGISQVGTLFQ